MKFRLLLSDSHYNVITFSIYPSKLSFFSSVPVLLCWHQLRSLWATLQYHCDHFLQPHTVECSLKYRKEKQRKSIVIYKPHFLFLNDHPKDIWLNLLLRRLLTYPSFVDINSVLYEHLYNISVTMSCSLRERSALTKLEKKNNEKV